jgi:hypothetical protein
MAWYLVTHRDNLILTLLNGISIHVTVSLIFQVLKSLIILINKSTLFTINLHSYRYSKCVMDVVERLQNNSQWEQELQK